jgi:hypothetical protein
MHNIFSKPLGIAMKLIQEHKVRRTETVQMRSLMSILGVTMTDKIKSGEIRKLLETENVVEDTGRYQSTRENQKVKGFSYASPGSVVTLLVLIPLA